MSRLTLLLPLLAIQVNVPRAWACSCAQTTPIEAAEAAGSAYVAEVVGVGLAGCGRHRSVRVEVVDAIVGIEEGEIVTRDVDTSEGASCGMEFPFETGDRWIFYGEGELNLCSPDEPYDESVVAQLRDHFE